MLIRFLSHGRGSGQAAAAYLLRRHDHRGTPREEIQVLRGNPKADAKLIDNLNFKHRYSSGVIAWAPEDDPTDEQIQEVLDDFEQVAFAGLQSNQYTWSAVLHREKGGGVHVHMVIPKVELQSGKSFNVAPPRSWMKDLNPVAEMHNHRHGWARPDDPARRRLVSPGVEAKPQATAKRAGVSEPTTKLEITAWLEDRITSGLIENRQGIRDSLAELGKITREGDDYISVLLPGKKRAVKLKGLLYDREFNPGLIQAVAAEKAKGSHPDPAAARRAARKFKAACERRRARNIATYRAGIAKGMEAVPAVAAEDLVHSPDLSRADAVGPGHDRGWDPAEAGGGAEIEDPGIVSGGEHISGRPGHSMDADENSMEASGERSDPGPEWPLPYPDRLEGEENAGTNRDRAGLAEPDWENTARMEREGNSFDEACRYLVQQSKRFDNATSISAQIDEAFRAIGEALGRWVAARQLEKEEAKLVLKKQEKRPDNEFDNPFLLDLKPPW